MRSLQQPLVDVVVEDGDPGAAAGRRAGSLSSHVADHSRGGRQFHGMFRDVR